MKPKVIRYKKNYMENWKKKYRVGGERAKSTTIYKIAGHSEQF